MYIISIVGHLDTMEQRFLCILLLGICSTCLVSLSTTVMGGLFVVELVGPLSMYNTLFGNNGRNGLSVTVFSLLLYPMFHIIVHFISLTDVEDGVCCPVASHHH